MAIEIDMISVSNAAEKLLGEGLKPTIDRVREKLQGGSKSTISPLLKVWRDNRRNERILMSEARSQNVPEYLKTTYENFLNKIWHDMYLDMDTQIQLIKDEEELERKYLEEDLHSLNETISDHEDTMSKNKKEISILNDMINLKEQDISGLKVKNAMLREQYAKDNEHKILTLQNEIKSIETESKLNIEKERELSANKIIMLEKQIKSNDEKYFSLVEKMKALDPNNSRFL